MVRTRGSTGVPDLEIPLSCSYVFAGVEPLPLAVVSAFLWLGKKYNIEVLVKDAMETLAFEYPSTLMRWDARNDSMPMIDLDYTGAYFDVVKLARENNLACLLPAVLFECIHIAESVKLIFHGERQNDGSLRLYPMRTRRFVFQAGEKIQHSGNDYLLL
jgi:hypothetical protein